MKYLLNGQEVSREEWLRGAPGITPGCPPAAMTDREFLEGHCNGSQFEKTPHIGDLYARQARAAGVDPKGKVYKAGLARFPGDPQAWVSGRGDVERICRERGWHAEGAVKVQGRKFHHEPVDLDESLVEAEAGSGAGEEVKEKIRKKRRPPWSKKHGVNSKVV